MLKNKTMLLSVTAISILFTSLSQANIQIDKSYPNENAIIFKTMGGKTTNAFEGYIEVPENRSNPKSRTILVKYVRFPATGNAKGSPIVYLSGGPGGSGINTAKYPNFRFPLFMALREFGDVIALDQRGTGASNDTPKCVSSQTLALTEQLTQVQVIESYQMAANECVEFWQKQDIDVHGYTTQESAHDIDTLRKHFNADKVTLWGISYGSHLAFATMKIFEGKIDKVVIASAEGLNQTVKLPTETDAYFARLQQAINTQPEASVQFPAIVELMHRVHRKLDQAPLKVEIPQKGGSSQEMLFQKMHLQIIASSMIADPQRGVSHLLALYHTLDQGLDGALIAILQRGYFSNEPISFNLMAFAMDIASGITDERLTLVNKQAEKSLLGLALNFPMPQLNKAVKGLDLGDKFREFPVNNIPTLLLTGTLDGRTYINSQSAATKGLSNLTQVKIINGGHNVFMVSPKVTEVIKTFLKGEKITTEPITINLPSFAMKN